MLSITLAGALALGAPDLALGRQLAEAIALCDAQQQRLWPGYDLSAIPILFHQRGGQAWLLNHPTPYPPGFTAVPELPGAAVQLEGGRYPGGIDIAYQVGDRQVVTVSLGDNRVAEKLVTAVHEAFHNYQRRKRFGKVGRSADIGVDSATDLALAELEQLLLADALDTPDPERKRELARLFLAVRTTRHGRVPLSLSEAERSLEAIEGTANYVESNARIVAAEASKVYGFARSRDAVLAEISTRLRTPLSPLTFSRFRYYQTGATMAFLLDGLTPSWHQRVEDGAAPQDLLAWAVNYDVARRGELFKLVESHYNLAGAIRRHTALLREVERRRQALLDTFKASTGTRIIVELPFGYGGYSTVSEGESFETTTGHFYETVEVSKEVPRGPSVSLRGSLLMGLGRAHYRFMVYDAVRPQDLTIDGQPAGPGKHQGALQLRTPHARITAAAASVEWDKDVLTIRLD